MSANNSKYFGKNPGMKEVEKKATLKFTFNKEENNSEDFKELNNASTLGYLNEKLKHLEIENNELKKEILSGTTERSKLEYYLRIRKDLLEEIERLKSEKNYTEQILSSKNSKLEEEIERLSSKLKANNINLTQTLINNNNSSTKDDQNNFNFMSSRMPNQLNPNATNEEAFLSSNRNFSSNQNNNFKDLDNLGSIGNPTNLMNLISPSSCNNTNKNLKALFSVGSINANNTNNNSLKYFGNLNFESDNEITQNFSDINYYNVESNTGQFNQKQPQDKETMGFHTQIYNNNNLNSNPLMNSNAISPEENLSLANFVNNNIGLSSNPFVGIIQDLEGKIKILENLNKEKDQEIENIKSQTTAEKSFITSEKLKLKDDLEALNQSYLAAITAKKTSADELKEIAEENFYNVRKEKDNVIHDLEKKIILLEKLNEKHLKDIERLIAMNSQADIIKQNQIEALKNSLKLVILEYEAIYKAYEDNLKTLVKQVDSLKQLYLARENEFLNITAYYTKTINEYAAPIYELNAQTKNKRWEEMYYEQIKEIDELRKNLENSLRENNQLRAECIDSKPKIRQRINDALTNYEFKLSEITETHDSLLHKLNKLFSYMDFFENKFTFFNSLIEDNKKLMEQLTLSECNLKTVSGDNIKIEFIKLKEANLKLGNELDMKNNLLKDYENLFEQMKTPNFSAKDKENNTNVTNAANSNYYNNNSNGNNNNNSQKKKANFVNDEIILKLNAEISLLSNQIANLNKTRAGVENFYQSELKKLADNLQDKNDKIEELKGVIRRIENDFIAKKETVYNLWILEFKEFKENLITLTDIKGIIEKFRAEGEDLNSHKLQILNEEIYLARQEVAKKDEVFSSQKKNFEAEIKETKDLLESYKKNFSAKLESLDKLIKLREVEFGSLMSEKENLIKIEENKKKVNFNNSINRLINFLLFFFFFTLRIFLFVKKILIRLLKLNLLDGWSKRSK